MSKVRLKSDNYDGSANLLDVIQIVLIILKLCHLIDWPWLAVLTPLILSLISIVLFMIILSICRYCRHKQKRTSVGTNNGR